MVDAAISTRRAWDEEREAVVGVLVAEGGGEGRKGEAEMEMERGGGVK